MVTFRLVQYKQLLNQMDAVDKIVGPQVNKILDAVNQTCDSKGDKEKESNDKRKSRVPNYKMLDKLVKRAKKEAMRKGCRENIGTTNDTR